MPASELLSCCICLYLLIIFVQIISEYNANSVSHRIVYSVLVKIDWILFVKDYNKLPQSERSIWLNDGYLHAKSPASFLQTLEFQRQILHNGLHEVSSWKKEMGRDTMARNRLLELFLAVSPPLPLGY